MKNKKLVIAVVAFVAIVAVLAGVYFGTRQDPNAGKKAYTITVVHSDGSEKEFRYTTDEEYLGDALVAEGLIAGDITEFGLTIVTVDGEDAVWDTDSAYWALYVGEEYATTGISSTPVNDGDSFKLEYTKFE